MPRGPVAGRRELADAEPRHWPGGPARVTGKEATGVTPAPVQAQVDAALVVEAPVRIC